jgi:hypothetical protein
VTQVFFNVESSVGVNMSDPSSQHHVAALLWICSENLDEDLIRQKLGYLNQSLVRDALVLRKGEWNVVSDKRVFDRRIYLDRWCQSLTTNQSQGNLEKQLEFWVEKLYPVRSAFQEFKQLGYWSVIDCQLAAKSQELPSIQFRLTQELQLKLFKIGVDLDFTIYRPTNQI